MQNNPPDLLSLRCFQAAAATLNFRSAAGTVHLSPAAFGERIRMLEEELEVQLFERSTRHVALTAAGSRLLPYASRLLDDANRLREVVQEPDQPTPYALTIGTRYELGMSWLLPALDPLKDQAPERTIHLYFGDSDGLITQLQNERIDGFVSSVRFVDPGLDYAPLHEERYVFLGSRRLLEKEPLRRAADAGRHVLIDAHPDLPLFRYFLDAVSAEQAWSFASIEYLGTIGAVRSRVLDGAGVAVLPLYFVKEDLQKSRLKRLLPRAKLQTDFFRLIWKKHTREAKRLRKLAESLRRRPLQ